MPLRSLLLVLGLSITLAACDRAQESGAQQQGSLQADKAVLTGTVDRAFAGQLLPAINVAHPDGQTLNLGAVQGQPVLINLWATWCAPCVVEMPMLDRLADELGDEARVITVSQDLRGADLVTPFFAKHGYRNLEPWLDPDNALGDAIGGGILPVTVLYDASGQEVFRVAGGYEWDSEEAIAQIREGLSE